MKHTTLMNTLWVALFGIVPTAVEAGDIPGKIEPPDVYARVSTIHQELELIRQEMGKPRPGERVFDVVEAQPREVYFQAATLVKKSSQLCMQITGDCKHLSGGRARLPDPMDGSIVPGHVFALVDDALKCVRRSRRSLGMPNSTTDSPRDATKTPTDVFQSIVSANRQLDELSDVRFCSSECFQQITLALYHATALRAHFPGKRLPAIPAFVRAKRPADVYGTLAQCYERMGRIARLSGVQILELHHREVASEAVLQSDVYDVASLLVAELAHLHVLLTGKEPVDDSYPPGRKFPSHVYQRARLLERQLEQLELLVGQNPSWLREQQTTQ